MELLFKKLTTKRIDYPRSTKDYVQKMLVDGDQEEEDLCAATSLRVSLVCPLGKARMKYPCKAKVCTHAQCFDAKTFVKVYSMEPTMKCPICKRSFEFDDLKIDGFFAEVLLNLSEDPAVKEIKLLADGTWEPVRVTKSATSISESELPAKKPKVEISIRKRSRRRSIDGLVRSLVHQLLTSWNFSSSEVADESHAEMIQLSSSSGSALEEDNIPTVWID
ncbi:E3 SUMO-protein ligase PIAS2 [Orchesella cincta]|uniref:E3 SUMO-protein ligase PIAS2 n=1 Tax=Orchesella cincta TaxID=48709 RepID=A0A1D2ME36_ORCCI|nr:E3 SUMO-protein ligase PIAS2 [Orchesella cincta]